MYKILQMFFIIHSEKSVFQKIAYVFLGKCLAGFAAWLQLFLPVLKWRKSALFRIWLRWAWLFFSLTHGTYIVCLHQLQQFQCVCFSTANKHVWKKVECFPAHVLFSPELRRSLPCERLLYLVVFTTRWHKSIFKKCFASHNFTSCF